MLVELRRVTLPLWASEKVRRRRTRPARCAAASNNLHAAFKARIAETNLPHDLEFPQLSATRLHALRHTHLTLGATDAAQPYR